MTAPPRYTRESGGLNLAGKGQRKEGVDRKEDMYSARSLYFTSGVTDPLVQNRFGLEIGGSGSSLWWKELGPWCWSWW